jgi:hypothetical protein
MFGGAWYALRSQRQQLGAMIDSTVMDLVEYAKGIAARRREVVTLTRAAARIGDWEPQAAHCHNNVRAWVKHNPHHKQVFGYVLVEITWLGILRVIPDSAVEDKDGVLYDITPHGASQDYPFIRHVGSDDEFQLMAEAVQVDVPIKRPFSPSGKPLPPA